MDRIGLAETIGALRQELAEAIAVAEDEAVQFPVEGVELEFHVGVTRNVDGDAGINFWVVELGKAEGVAREEIQRVSVTLGRPVVNGRPVRVRRELDSRP